MRAWLVVSAIAIMRTARADVAVLDELSAGSSETTPTNPRSQYIADKLGGMWGPADAWQLRFDATATRDFGTKPVMGSFGDSGGTVLLFDLSAEYDPRDEWSLKLMGGFSPKSTTKTATTVSFQNVNDADAQLTATTSSAIGQAQIGWDQSGGDAKGDFLPAATITGTVTDYDTKQAISAVQTKAGRVLNVSDIQTFCASHACSGPLLASIKGQEATLVQYVLDLSVGAQLFTSNDVAIDFQAYFYNQDPTQVGYFSLVSAGRSASFGGGIGIEPLEYALGASYDHRWGQLLALLNLTYGGYVDNNGYNVTANVRVQYKWKFAQGRRLKVWGKLTGARDFDYASGETKSGALALGAQYQW